MNAVAAEFLLAGRPNSGKSSLFNLLAGANQKVGNYAGCTVEKKTAVVEWYGTRVAITDLPGLFSLKPNSVDEAVALAELDSAPLGSHIVTVLDGNNLRHELALPLLLKQKGYSVVVAVNMIDEVRANKKILDLAGMTELAGIPFFAISAKTGEGVEALKKFIAHMSAARVFAREPIKGLPNEEISALLDGAMREADRVATPHVICPVELPLDRRTDRIDAWLTHKIAGPIVFLATMFLVFQSVFTWAGPASDLVDAAFAAIGDWVRATVPWPILASLLADGVIAGVGAVVVFVPQIALLFLMIALLELSGYLPRAAYMVDRLMKPYGLDGKVFVPLLSSMACAVPGIMAARTVENPRTRLVTIMISPLMTCSARLPVYTLLIATFVPAQTVFGFSLQGLVMAGMYLLGIVMALVVALVLRFSLSSVPGRNVDFIHLPSYRTPDLRNVARYVRLRIWMFLKKAGTIIASMAILLWVLLSFPRDRAFLAEQEAKLAAIAANAALSEAARATETNAIQNQIASHNLEYSIGGRIGKFVEPAFAPLGYDWKLSIGLLASLAAREVFVATLGTVFALGEVDEGSMSLVEALQGARKADGTPAYSIATCLSLLVFFAFSLQCISTIGVARREANSWRVPIAMFAYMFLLAYVGAFVAYRIGLVLFA